jgi:23S rRNA (uracil1939-C5)-methyltransferase
MEVLAKKNTIVDLEIFDLAYGGKGVAKLDGMIVLVAGGIPGDLVKARIVKRKTSFAQAEVLEVIKESELREKPSCSHFGLCGGCKWQNLKYQHQLYYKAKQVKDSLVHLGSFSEPNIKEILGSENIFYYRNKMEFTFGKDENGRLILGLHPAERYEEVFDLKKCFLQSEASNEIVDWIKQFLREKNLLPYDIRKHSGFLRFLAIREGKNTGEAMANLVTHQGEFPYAYGFSSGLTKEFPQIKSVVRNINSKLANIALGEKEEVSSGDRIIYEKLKNFTFEISANSFFQTNTFQAEKLFDKVLDLTDLSGSENVLDLYSGTGTISIFLSTRAKKVVGVESLADSIENAKRNASRNDIKNVEFILGEAKEVLSSLQKEKNYFEVVVVDPPRAGLHPDVLKHLINLKPQKIIYVSCNPTTLARDLSASGGLCERYYDLDEVHPVDMFPHTFHIETVARLVLRS